MRRALAVFGLAVLHFVASICLFGILYTRGMAAFDQGSSDTTLFDSIVGQIVLILWFPFYPLAWWLNIPSGSIYEWSLLIGTSILWGVAAYAAIYFVRRWRGERIVSATPTV